MTDTSKQELIEEASKEAERRWPSPNTSFYEGLVSGFKLGAAWAVFEQAHTPANDERKVPGFAEREKRAARAWEFFSRDDREMSHEFRAGYHQGVIDESRRTAVQEPSAHDCTWACWVDRYGFDHHSEPQGEPKGENRG